ncbi:VIT1/CCC1 transporter family protein [Streptococcus pluranimalium]|uniref:VIT1/CCC1 transporter family protein n=1 Tax=Streptococcus pluranimalium TaxID=82348 RepID=UPI0024158027|nr:VIT1/CCC1 transporter family protein [Streptococcus pluranimalium]WFM79007.1 VIT1/CCC1 transporter family protein [Streptococcus pluranimalium]
MTSITKLSKVSFKNSWHFNLQDHAKSITYGGLDGIITTFAVVAGATGGNLGTTAIVILGFSNLLADGFSMAAGDYLSSTTEDHDEPRHALKNAIATFLAFNIFGLVPLFAYLLLEQFTQMPRHWTLILASTIVSLALTALGWVKATITRQSLKVEITRTLIVGLLAAGVAYGIGQVLGELI